MFCHFEAPSHADAVTAQHRRLHKKRKTENKPLRQKQTSRFTTQPDTAACHVRRTRKSE